MAYFLLVFSSFFSISALALLGKHERDQEETKEEKSRKSLKKEEEDEKGELSRENTWVIQEIVGKYDKELIKEGIGEGIDDSKENYGMECPEKGPDGHLYLLSNCFNDLLPIIFSFVSSEDRENLQTICPAFYKAVEKARQPRSKGGMDLFATDFPLKETWHENLQLPATIAISRDAFIIIENDIPTLIDVTNPAKPEPRVMGKLPTSIKSPKSPVDKLAFSEGMLLFIDLKSELHLYDLTYKNEEYQCVPGKLKLPKIMPKNGFSAICAHDKGFLATCNGMLWKICNSDIPNDRAYGGIDVGNAEKPIWEIKSYGDGDNVLIVYLDGTISPFDIKIGTPLHKPLLLKGQPYNSALSGNKFFVVCKQSNSKKSILYKIDIKTWKIMASGARPGFILAIFGPIFFMLNPKSNKIFIDIKSDNTKVKNKYFIKLLPFDKLPQLPREVVSLTVIGNCLLASDKGGHLYIFDLSSWARYIGLK